MLIPVKSAFVQGITATVVTVEVHLAATGLPGLSIVGQPSSICREVRDRVRAAIVNSGLEWPNRRITVNIAGCQSRMWAGFDLAIAVGVLAASEQLDTPDADDDLFVGELRLDGSIVAPRGLVPIIEAGAWLFTGIAPVSTAVDTTRVSMFDTLARLVDIDGEPCPVPAARVDTARDLRFDSIVGMPWVKFAAEVAAAGHHHLLLTGRPGAGGAAVAARVAGLLPDLGADEVREREAISSAAGREASSHGRPPTVTSGKDLSPAAFTGGATSALLPGAVTVAHSGVLVIDDLAGLSQIHMDALRAPMRDGTITVSRGHRTEQMPAGGLVVAVTRPCPCSETPCVCSPNALARHRRRVAGPLLDLFDLRVNLGAPHPKSPLADMFDGPDELRWERVAVAREAALVRRLNGGANGDPDHPTCVWLLQVGAVTSRGAARVAAIARTVADLVGSDSVADGHYLDAALLSGVSPDSLPA